MPRFTILAVFLGLAAVSAWPCTGAYHAAGGRVLVGNNEDFSDPDTYIWAFPSQAGRCGRIYFGYAFSPVQGGVNDKGLYFDGFALPQRNVTDTRPYFAGDLIQTAMERCSLVTEVAALFSSYNLKWLSASQLMFGDRRGNSMIVECDTILLKQGAFQVATNFSQSATPPDSFTCPRYAAATRILSGAALPSLSTMRSVLDSTHVAGTSINTLYSNIYDLTVGLITLYQFHDFGTARTLDAAAEMAAGPSVRTIRSLFPANAAAAAHKARMDSIIAAYLAARPRGSFDSMAPESPLGKYVVDRGYQRIGDTLTLTYERPVLRLEFSSFRKFGVKTRLYPDTAADRFFSVSHFGETMVRCERDSAGRAAGLWVGTSYHAVKAGWVAVESPIGSRGGSGVHFSVSPNPVRGTARFSTSGPSGFPGGVLVYDVRGHLVAVLKSPGPAAVLDWRPGSIPAGLYFAILAANGNRRSLRFLVLP